MSDEFFTRDAHGRKVDAPLHEPILDNVEANKQIQADAVQRAIDDGLSPEDAEALYGYRAPSEYS
jgi:hypothetical protein